MQVRLDVHGMTWPEARAAFREAYAGIAPSKGKVEVIHGYGSTGVGGVLGLRLRKFLGKQGALLTFKTGDEIDGNPGWTVVTATGSLPDDDEILEDAILDYCQQPRTMSKIVGKFRRFGTPKVQEAVKSLSATPPLLIKVVKPRHDEYQTISTG